MESSLRGPYYELSAEELQRLDVLLDQLLAGELRFIQHGRYYDLTNWTTRLRVRREVREDKPYFAIRHVEKQGLTSVRRVGTVRDELVEYTPAEQYYGQDANPEGLYAPQDRQALIQKLAGHLSCQVDTGNKFFGITMDGRISVGLKDAQPATA